MLHRDIFIGIKVDNCLAGVLLKDQVLLMAPLVALLKGVYGLADVSPGTTCKPKRVLLVEIDVVCACVLLPPANEALNDFVSGFGQTLPGLQARASQLADSVNSLNIMRMD